MIVPDLNLVVYAHNRADFRYEKAKAWWEGCLTNQETIGLSWAVILGFVRIVTNRRIFKEPTLVSDAIEAVESWLASPQVQVLHPGPDHARLVFGYLREVGTAGDLTSDAHLAALAREYQGIIHSADNDFARFSGLRWKNPLK
jgi:uncharacterized protein